MADGPRVAIRLGIVGDAEVKATLDAIGETGEASAKRAGNEYARQSKIIEDAIAKQARAAAQVQTVLATSGAGTKYTGDQNAQVKAYQQYMEQQRQAAEALRNAIDPLRVAQAAYDRELEVSATLLRTGNITEKEYADAVALSGRTLQQTRVRLGEHEEGFTRMGASGMIAEHVVRSFSDSLAAGQSPIRAATMEMGRVTEALTMWAAASGQTEGKVGALAAFMGGPWGLALSVGIAVLTPLVGKLFETDDAAKKAAEGLAEFEKKQQDLSRYIDQTTGKLREQNRLLAAIQAGAIPAQIGAAATETQGYVNAAFYAARQKVKAEGSSRAGPNDPALNRTILAAGSNSADLQRGIAGLVEGGRKDLADLLRMVTEYSTKAAEGAGNLKQLAGQQGALNVALHGGVVVSTAYAAEQVDRQLATDRVSAAQQHLSDVEAKASDIDAMPYGPAKIAAVRAYQAQLLSAKAAVEAAQKADRDASAAAREHTKDVNAAARAYREFQEALEKTWGSLENANREFSKKFAGEWAAQFKQLGSQMDADQKDRMAPSEFMVQQIAGQQQANQLSQVELATVGMNADQRQRVLDLMKATLDLDSKHVDLSSDQAKTFLAGVEAQDRLNEAIQRSSASMQEVRDFASQFVDDLASSKNVVKDLEQEFIKLALLNPLKNLINGNSAAPTLGSVFGSVSKLFGGGGGSSAASALPSFASIFAGFASGTDYAPGGLAWVGENGPELMNVPRGASITPVGQSRRIMDAANNNQTHVVVQVQAGQMFDATVASISDTRIGAAAPVIADGGAKLGNRYAAQMRRRKLGRY